jgi:hypothetical protein
MDPYLAAKPLIQLESVASGSEHFLLLGSVRLSILRKHQS